jgi:cytidylate kinase
MGRWFLRSVLLSSPTSQSWPDGLRAEFTSRYGAGSEALEFFDHRLLDQLAWVIYDRIGHPGSGRRQPGGTDSDARARPNIMISGLTAAGKTTHALLLAQALGYDYVSASTILADRLSTSRDDPWRQRRRELHATRSPGIDLSLDAQCTTWARSRSGIVFDAWVLPLLDVAAPKVVVWIESSRRSRALKCRVSQLTSRAPASVEECERLVTDIDTRARSQFTNFYGVDLDSIPNSADVVLDNTAHIRRSTWQSAVRGIRSFHDELLSAVRGAVEQ